MAEAVEGAAVVLMLYSQGYAQSRNCQFEVSYVSQLAIDYIPLLAEDGADKLRGEPSHSPSPPSCRSLRLLTSRALHNFASQPVYGFGCDPPP